MGIARSPGDIDRARAKAVLNGDLPYDEKAVVAATVAVS